MISKTECHLKHTVKREKEEKTKIHCFNEGKNVLQILYLEQEEKDGNKDTW